MTAPSDSCRDTIRLNEEPGDDSTRIQIHGFLLIQPDYSKENDDDDDGADDIENRIHALYLPNGAKSMMCASQQLA